MFALLLSTADPTTQQQQQQLQPCSALPKHCAGSTSACLASHVWRRRARGDASRSLGAARCREPWARVLGRRRAEGRRDLVGESTRNEFPVQISWG
ncbi:unnamed protein product [Lampetra planeri]